MKTAVLWNRVSSPGQEHGYSPDSQDYEMGEVAKKYEVVENYRLTESSKTSERRKAFKEMIDFVIANKVDTIIAWSRSRLGRNFKDDFVIQSLIDDHNVTVVLVKDGKAISKDSPPQERFLFQLMGGISDHWPSGITRKRPTIRERK